VYWGWWVVAANSVMAFASGFHLYGTTVYFLPLAESLNLSRGALSFVFAASRLEGGLEGPLVGWMIDRFGPRQLMLGGAVLVGVGYILLATVVDGFWSLFLVYTVLISTGASAGFFAPFMASVNRYFVRRRTTAIGVVGTALRGANFLLTPLLAFMVLNLGWQRAAMIAGVVIMVTVLSLAWVNRPSPESMGQQPDGDKAGAEGQERRRLQAQRAARRRTQPAHDFTLRQALRTPTFWMLVLAQGCRFLVTGALMVHLVPILVWKGMDQQSAANMVGLVALVSVPAVLFFGWAGDRFSMHKVASLAALGGAAGLAILTFSTKPWHLYGFVVLHGIAEASFPVILSMTGEYFGRKNFATLRGTTQLFTAGGGFAATLLTGWIYDWTGAYTIALVPMVFVAAASVGFFFLIRYPRLPRGVEAAAEETLHETPRSGGAEH
jgi:MFS family permease